MSRIMDACVLNFGHTCPDHWTHMCPKFWINMSRIMDACVLKTGQLSRSLDTHEILDNYVQNLGHMHVRNIGHMSRV